MTDRPDLFLNRELSWIRFNAHVLAEAANRQHPLLERVRFLSIFANNLDEFFMIRVSGLIRQVRRGALEFPPDGMNPTEQLAAIHRDLEPLLEAATACWHSDLVPGLGDAGIHIRAVPTLDDAERQYLKEYFEKEVFPALTPLAFDKTHPFPFISNLSMNLAIIVRDGKGQDFFVRLKVPTDIFPRLIHFPVAGGGAADVSRYVYLEDLIASHLDLLFPGLTVIASHPFRITRDADIEIEEDEASDLLTAIEESVEQRRTGQPVRVEIARDMPEQIASMVGGMLGVPGDRFYRLDVPLGMSELAMLCAMDRADLKYTPFTPAVQPLLDPAKSMFSAIRERDILLFHPYESFTPVVRFLKESAADPQVLAIKMTLYRVGPNSPIVQALLEARENGKAVAVLVELKARFDEENNIGWAKALERAGVHVVYGIAGLKVHAKICLVVRREKDGIIRYVHLGTGNYNPETARVYTDLGLFTADPTIGDDILDLFNALTGYSSLRQHRVIHAAPYGIRDAIITRIDREIARQEESGDGMLIFKMNALVDHECIAALYKASRAGVRIHLQVRGICCLRPGIPGVSDRVDVTTIVGRFLEHARLYYFHNGGDDEILLGSADLMPRNLDRRVEILFPVRDPRLRRSLRDTFLKVQMRDSAQSRRLLADGTYEKIDPPEGHFPFSAQEWFIAHRNDWQEITGQGYGA